MTAYIQRFTAYLQNNLGITEEEFKKKYRCCVKSTDTDFRRFKKMCPNIEHLPHKTKCICGHKIVDNYYFVNRTLPEKDRTELVILGSKCSKRYLDEEQLKRRCEICDKPHKNIKDNYCKDCRINNKKKEKEEKKILTYTIDFGKHYGKKPHEIPKDYLSWILSKKSDKYLSFEKKNKVKEYIKVYEKKINKEIDFID
jgi:hypothetical protein